MTIVSIPQWTSQGVLPPINPIAPTSAERSPYPVSLTDVILRYATSPARHTILDGILRFRAALNSIGLDHGFQWLNGSFLENIELIENRNPRDIDVVTFFHLPDGQTQESLALESPRLFNPVYTKPDYNVDAYFVQLNGDQPEPLVAQSAYWYSMWAHRRNEQWKGYLQIDLSSMDDPIAKANLVEITTQGGRP